MAQLSPRFDNLQNELRRELDPKGFLEEEVFLAVWRAVLNCHLRPSARYEHERAFFQALRELRTLQAKRTRRAKVIEFPKRPTSSPRASA
jgi:hypothetical protein